MANARPIVVNKDMVALGGNMRLKAMQEAGWSEVPVKVVDWSEEKQREFIIKDNVGFGDWDWDELANTWDAEELNEWGLDTWQPEDFSEKNQELDVNGFEDEMIIKLKYTDEDYQTVRDQLSKIADTPEQAVWKLLGNE